MLMQHYWLFRDEDYLVLNEGENLSKKCRKFRARNRLFLRINDVSNDEFVLCLPDLSNLITRSCLDHFKLAFLELCICSPSLVLIG